jgi:hypothetical protein
VGLSIKVDKWCDLEYEKFKTNMIRCPEYSRKKLCLEILSLYRMPLWTAKKENFKFFSDYCYCLRNFRCGNTWLYENVQKVFKFWLRVLERVLGCHNERDIWFKRFKHFHLVTSQKCLCRTSHTVERRNCIWLLVAWIDLLGLNQKSFLLHSTFPSDASSCRGDFSSNRIPGGLRFLLQNQKLLLIASSHSHVILKRN